MDKWLDLHMHSVYSADGEFSPEELMRKCSGAGLRAVALADHNSTQGVPFAKRIAEELGVIYFPAIEIDCIHEGRNFHLLGYGIRSDGAGFKEIEQNVYEQEVAGSKKLLELIRRLGFYFDEKQVRTKAGSGVIAAETIAEVVLNDLRNKDNKLLLPFRQGGERSDNPFVNFYWDFCAQGKPAYVSIHYISLETAVDTIRENGGAAVLAHPGANMGKNYGFTKSIIDKGLDGIEVYSNYHDDDTKKFYKEICNEYGLIATSGSDFHGKTKPAIRLGELAHPDANSVYDQLEKKIKERGGEVYGNYSGV